MRLILSIFFVSLLSLTPNVYAKEEENSIRRTPSISATRENLKVERREIKNIVGSKREEIKSKIDARREENKARIAEFKDKKRAQIASRVDENLTFINEKRTTKMLEAITRMNALVLKLEDRIETADSEGKDTSKAVSALEKVNAAIALAENAISTQAGKDYGVQITSEDTVKTDLKSARDALLKDLKSTHALLVSARQSLAQSVNIVKSLRGEN